MRKPTWPAVKGVAEVWVANHNSPHQTVVAGTEAGLKLAAEKLQAANVRAQRIPMLADRDHVPFDVAQYVFASSHPSFSRAGPGQDQYCQCNPAGRYCK